MDLKSVIGHFDKGKAYSAAEVTEKCDKLEAELAWRELDFCSYTVSHSLLLEKGVSGICQPAYACLTCAASSGKPVGLCDACMIKCHVDHEIIECGERNQFRCDCPTSNCAKPDGSFGCKAQPLGGPTTVQHANGTNSYDHNFQNKFCSCNADYDADADTMYQCCACNEWYHEGCLQGGVTLPAEGPGTEAAAGTALVCAACVALRPYLKAFACYTPGVCAAPAQLAGPSAPATASASPGDSPGTGHVATQGQGQGEYPIQPWRVCLTCSGGQEDGLGVCMACAEACHTGHNLLPPRISAFQCDCVELLAKPVEGRPAGKQCCCAVSPDTTAALATSTAAATPAPSTAGKRSASALTEVEVGASKRSKLDVDHMAHPPSLPPAPAPAPAPSPASSPARAPPKWCCVKESASSPASAPVFVPSTCIMLDDLVPLIDQLCTCEACLHVYAHDGLLSWWVNDPEEDGCIVGEEEGGDSAAVMAPGTARGKWVLHPQWAASVLDQAGHQAVKALLMGHQSAQKAAAAGHSVEPVSLTSSTAPESAPSGGAGSGTGHGSVVYPAGYIPMLQRSDEALAALEPAQQLPLLQGFVDFKSSFAAFLEEKSRQAVEAAAAGSPGAGHGSLEVGPEGRPVFVVTEEVVKEFMAKFSAEQRQKRELELRGIR